MMGCCLNSVPLYPFVEFTRLMFLYVYTVCFCIVADFWGVKNDEKHPDGLGTGFHFADRQYSYIRLSNKLLSNEIIVIYSRLVSYDLSRQRYLPLLDRQPSDSHQDMPTLDSVPGCQPIYTSDTATAT